MNSGNPVLRSLERTLKRFLSRFLRLLLGSRPLTSPLGSDFQSILLIRQHNQLGDMLCVVPLLRELRKKFPAACIALMASPVNYDVMLHNRYIDELILFDKRAYLGRLTIRLGLLIRFVRSLRQKRYDLAIVPATVSLSFTSDLLAFLSGARTRIGPGSIGGSSNPSAFFLNAPVILDWRSEPHRHQTRRNSDVAQQLGISPTDCSLEITLLEPEKNDGNLFIHSIQTPNTLTIGFHPGAGKVPNRWPPERFAEVANRLAEEFHAALLVTAGPMDDGPVEHMVGGLSHPYHVLKNQPIRRVASILSRVQLLISNDTGIMHVGAAVNVPVLSLFGPTDAGQWAPLGKRHRCLMAEDGEIASITVEAVLRNAREMLLEFAGQVA